MRFSVASALLFLASAANAASSWGFTDGKVTIASKGDARQTEKFTSQERVKSSLKLAHGDTLKLSLTAQEGSKAKRPHQAFLVVKESSGLEAPYPLTLKSSGAGAVEITHKDLPVQLLHSSSPLEATVIIGSFGASAGSITPVFNIEIVSDPAAPQIKPEAPLRYGKRDEIHHIFRADPKNPPKIVSLVFSLAVLATIPAVFGGWLILGGNVSHLSKALGAAPISHVVFFGSIIAIEGVFALYYTTWNLFHTLPVIIGLGAVAFLSGTKALGEVQSRRLAGER